MEGTPGYAMVEQREVLTLCKWKHIIGSKTILTYRLNVSLSYKHHQTSLVLPVPVFVQSGC